MARGVIDGGEIVILAIKPSMWRPLFDSAACMVGSWIIAGLLTILSKPITGLSMATTVQIVLMGGTVGLGVAILRWIPTWYVLTNRRIIHIHGIRTPRIDSCELLEIRNTFVQVGFEEKVTNLGSITFIMDKAASRPRTWAQSSTRSRSTPASAAPSKTRSTNTASGRNWVAQV